MGHPSFGRSYIDNHLLTAIDSRDIREPYMSSADSPLDRALHAIADPTRRRILQTLKRSADKVEGRPTGAQGHCLCAGQIEQQVRLSQPTISHHMAILTKAGLVEANKRGQWRWYRRNEKAIRQIVRMLRGRL